MNWLLGIALTLLASCSLPLAVDTRTLVQAGLSVVEVKSVSYLQNGKVVSTLASGVETTARIEVANPDNLEVQYSPGQVADSSFFSSLPQVKTGEKKRLEVVFTLAAAAENKSVTFAVVKSIPSTGKVYSPDSFTVPCDSPPSPVQNLTAGYNVQNTATVAFTMAEGATDTDLKAVRLSWRDLSEDKSVEVWTTVEHPFDSGLLTVPVSPDLLAGVTSTRKRYFSPSHLVAGRIYQFAVTVIDQAGQSSNTLTVLSSRVQSILQYRANGGTGTLPASQTVDFGGTLTVDPQSQGPALTPPSGKRFGGWNTAADGSGTSYAPGAVLTMNRSSMTLYTRWVLPPTVSVTLSMGSYQNWVSSSDQFEISEGQTLELNPNTGSVTVTDWMWYLDGTLMGSGPGLSIVPSLGFHILVITASVGGVSYSGSMIFTVTS